MQFNNTGQFGLMIPIGFDSGTYTKTILDSAFVFESAGDVVGIRFCSPVTQVSGALKLYVMFDDSSGTPKFRCEFHASAGAGEDYRKPDTGGAAVATSDELTSPANDEWVVFTFSGINLTVGMFYWLCVYNTAVTPESNYASMVTRGALDGHITQCATLYHGALQIAVYTDGFATAKTFDSTNLPPVVIEFNDGSVMGMPYIGTANHASNTNYRGNRVTINGKVTACGIAANVSQPAMNFYGIGDGTATPVVYTTPDECGEDFWGYFLATDLVAGKTYDWVAGYVSNITTGVIFDMVEIEANVPAAVKLARPCSYVDGAGLDSLTEDTSKIMGYMGLIIKDIPLVTGGGGGHILGRSLVR